MSTTRQDPLLLLRRMERDSLVRAPGLPEETQATVLWSGVAFRLGDMMLVTPLDHVSEVVPCPATTPVPGTRPWVKGIANIRGTLCTIVDLPEFFGKQPIFHDTRARLLVMNVGGLSTGLLVNEVMGLRHFDADNEKQDVSGVDDPVLVYLRGAFLRDKVLWGVFDMHALAESPAFLQVAA